MTNRILITLSLCVLVVAGCKPRGSQISGLQSGGGTDPNELGCQGLQNSFVDDGMKFEERVATFANQVAEYNAKNPGTSTQSNASGPAAVPGTGRAPSAQHPSANHDFPNFDRVGGPGSGNGNALDPAITVGHAGGFQLADHEQFRGVSKRIPFKGRLSGAFNITNLPESMQTEADCSRYMGKAPEGLYDTCVEMVKYYKRVTAIVAVWDNDSNKKRCFEGRSFDDVKNPEFGYCDNECGFNDEYCYDCSVKYAGGNSSQRFVCKSLKSATDAIGGFCRNTGIQCLNYEPEKACKRVKGIDLAGGTTATQGGKAEEMTTASLSGYLGASESVQVKAGIAAGQAVQARGTVVGTIGIKRSQGVGAMFTPSGLGVNGLQVQCILSVTGVASVQYEAKVGIGGDFILASGSATVDTGGSFSLTQSYVKTSPTFSGAGQNFSGLLQQCVNNYLAGWIGIELQNWVDKYAGLKAVRKAMNRLLSDVGLNETYYTLDSSNVYCKYTNYKTESAWKTSQLRVFNQGDHLDVQWWHYLSGWKDPASAKLTVNDDAIHPYLRDIRDSALAGDRLVEFFNQVVVPASKNERSNWQLDFCQ